MRAIVLFCGNIFFGFVAIICSQILFRHEYQTGTEFMGLLYHIFVFGILFGIAIDETIENLAKGAWR